MIETQIKQILPEEILILFKEKAIDEEWTFAEYKPSDRGFKYLIIMKKTGK